MDKEVHTFITTKSAAGIEYTFDAGGAVHIRLGTYDSSAEDLFYCAYSQVFSATDLREMADKFNELADEMEKPERSMSVTVGNETVVLEPEEVQVFYDLLRWSLVILADRYSSAEQQAKAEDVSLRLYRLLRDAGYRGGSNP